MDISRNRCILPNVRPATSPYRDDIERLIQPVVSARPDIVFLYVDSRSTAKTFVRVAGKLSKEGIAT